MKCLIRKQGESHLGKTTVAPPRGEAAVMIKQVPAGICENCGASPSSHPHGLCEITLGGVEEANARRGVPPHSPQIDLRQSLPDNGWAF